MTRRSTASTAPSLKLTFSGDASSSQGFDVVAGSTTASSSSSSTATASSSRRTRTRGPRSQPNRRPFRHDARERIYGNVAWASTRPSFSRTLPTTRAVDIVASCVLVCVAVRRAPGTQLPRDACRPADAGVSGDDRRPAPVAFGCRGADGDFRPSTTRSRSDERAADSVGRAPRSRTRRTFWTVPLSSAAVASGDFSGAHGDVALLSTPHDD